MDGSSCRVPAAFFARRSESSERYITGTHLLAIVRPLSLFFIFRHLSRAKALPGLYSGRSERQIS